MFDDDFCNNAENTFIGETWQIFFIQLTGYFGKAQQEVCDNLSVCLLNLQLVQSSPDTFSAFIYYFSLAWKLIWKSKK